MAKTNNFNIEGKKPTAGSNRAQRRVWSTSDYLPALCAGVVMVGLFLGVVSCSKKSTRPQASALPAEPSVQPSAATEPAPPAATAAVAKKTKAKRVRPLVVTYANSDYGVSFRYPRIYSLKSGESAQLAWPGLGPVGNDFVKPGGVALAAVELPENSYPETDFAGAFVNVSVNPSLTSTECMQFAAVGPDDAANQPAKVEISGMEFAEAEKIQGADNREADAKYYHAFQNGVCYEFALGVGTVADDADEGVAQVDRGGVFARLEKVLASVEIKPVQRMPSEAVASTGEAGH